VVKVGMLRLRVVGASLDATPLSMTVICWSSAAIEREILSLSLLGCLGLRARVSSVAGGD